MSDDASGGPDLSRALYPFLATAAARSGSDDAARVLSAVRDSTLTKSHDATMVRRQLLDEYREALVDAALAMAAAFERGGKLLAFGNGGSATDAQDAASDCMAPPVSGWRPLPALALVNDTAVVTAVANDVGFENVFLRQVIAFGESGDVALGFSTSGNSPNVLSALAEARRRGLVTVALSGGGGGALADARSVVQHCVIARTEHIPRVQEGHATAWHTLLALVQAVLGAPAGHHHAEAAT